MATRKRRPLTEAQRNFRSAATAARKAEEERRKTSSHSQAEARYTAFYKSKKRTENYDYETQEKKERRKDLHEKALQRASYAENERRTTATQRAQNAQVLTAQRAQTQAELAQLRSQESRRNRAFSEQLKDTGTQDGVAQPQISFVGGFTRSIFMAITLVVVYALVTHSQSSSTAIGNVGGIFGKLTSTQPLFVQSKA